jgi:site-specific recombinase XerD
MAKDAEMNTNLSIYSIRHSWATIAKYSGISTILISEGSGYSSVKTTGVHLKDFDNSLLGEMANNVMGLN